MTGDAPILDVAFSGTLGTFRLEASFTVPATGITGLFGPSGCGKTTVLRAIAGLERLQGHLHVAGEIWQNADTFKKPHERPVGFVFQDASLFPHLSVRGNLMFGARRTRKSNASPSIAWGEVVDLLGLGPLLDRSPTALSGGERQRVAIGRALLSRPRLMLLDEPLSALDRPAREEILPYLEMLHQKLAIPSLYVSHDIAEVERLADSIVLMDQGRVIASGPLAEIEADPALPLMHAPEAAVTLSAHVVFVEAHYGLVHLAVDGGRLLVPDRATKMGEARRLRIKASDVSFTQQRPVGTSILNCLPVRILSVDAGRQDPVHVNIVAGLGEEGRGARIVGRVTRKSAEALALVPDAVVFAQIKGIALMATGSG